MNGQAIGMAQGAQMGYANKPLGTVEARQAEIPHQMQMLENTLKGCYQGLDTLADRLESSVMRTLPPAPGANPTQPTAVAQTPHGSRLQEMTSAAAIVNERIQSLIARLEV